MRVDARALVELRDPVLFPRSPLPEPDGFAAVRASPSEDWERAADALADGLAANGLGLAYVEEPLSIEDFIALGRRFGTPLRETDPAIAPFVHESVVLSLQDRLRSDADQLTPFTPRPLTLHTEGSRRPAAEQPRCIILMCVDPGDAGDSSQTVLVPIGPIVEQLDDDDLRTLGGVRETVVPGSAPLLRRTEDQLRLSFRDLGEERYELESESDAATTRRAVTSLVRACYSARPVSGTRWRRGDIVAIDNRRWMHGRTGASTAGSRLRHLQRLRIIAS
jgi:hypothetical protein